MKYILLDTCVFVNCTLMNVAGADPELLVALVDRIRNQGAKLLLPDVVRFEYARKVPEELALINQQTKRFRDSVTTAVLPGPDVSKIHATLDKLDADRGAAAKRAQEYFEQVSRDSAVTIPIALDGDTMAEAVGYVLAGEKPSGEPDGGLLDPDSLIVASVALFARHEGFSATDTLLICSDNHKDFAQWNPDEGVHELAEVIAKRIPCPARYYKSPRLLLERELETEVEADETLSDALDQYERLAHTMSSIAVFSDILGKMQAMSMPTLDPSIIEGMKRAYTIDPGILQSIRHACTIDPDVLQKLQAISMPTIDPRILEIIRRAHTIDPEIVRHIRETMGVAGSDDATASESADRSGDEPENLTGPNDADDTRGDT